MKAKALALLVSVLAVPGALAVPLAPHAYADPPSSSEDWLRAVCQMGTFREGWGEGVLRNSTAQSSCLSNTGGGGIFFGQYASNFSMQNDVSIFKGGTYATAKASDGTIEAFMTEIGGSRGEEVLWPLTQFGFELYGA
jgi:hypothetical protein